MTTLPDLRPHDFRVQDSSENPLAAPMTRYTWKISDNREVWVTNHLGGVRYDQWLIVEDNKVVMPIVGLEYTSVIRQRALLTDALHDARAYVWTVYRKDILTLELPF